MESLERIWQEVKNNLTTKLNPNAISTFDSMKIVLASIEKDVVTLNVSGSFCQEWCENSYHNLLTAAFTDILGEKVEVCFVALNSAPSSNEEDTSLAKPQESKSRTTKKETAKYVSDTTSDLNDDEDDDALYTFDNYVVGDSNQLAQSACLGVAKKPGISYNPLFIYGPSGVGKTHLLNAICHYIKHHKRRIVTKMISADEFLNEFVEAMRDGKIASFRKVYRKVDVLLIDDIHFIADKEKTQEEFFHTFNTLFNARKQIVMVSDREPKDIKGLQARLVSRFEWGLTVDVKPPNLETRMAILAKKVKDQKVDVPQDVILLIAERIRSNVRRLEGALMKVVASMSLQDEVMTTEKAEALLQTWFLEEDKNANAKQANIADIQKVVAEHYDIRLADMSSKARPANIAMARQVAMYLCRKLTTLSAPTIGEAFCRNHTTVLHAVETIGKKIEKDRDFEREILVLEHRFNQN